MVLTVAKFANLRKPGFVYLAMSLQLQQRSGFPVYKFGASSLPYKRCQALNGKGSYTTPPYADCIDWRILKIWKVPGMDHYERLVFSHLQQFHYNYCKELFQTESLPETLALIQRVIKNGV